MKYRHLTCLLFAISLFALKGSVFGQSNPRVPANFSLQIHGQVRYAASHQPAENVLVRLESSSGGMIGQVTTDRSGKFSFTGLVAQQYNVSVHAPGYIDVSERVDLLTTNVGYLNVDLYADKNAVGSAPVRSASVFDIGAAVDTNVPAEAQAQYAKGKNFLFSDSSSNPTEAAKAFEKAVSIYPKYRDAQILLGLAYMDLQKWDAAEKALTAAIELDDHVAAPYFALGEVYLRQKKYPEGEKALSAGLKIEPKNARAHLTFAELLWDAAPAAKDETVFRANAERAWKEVTQALAIDPNMGEAHLLAGNMLLRARRPEEALHHFEEYLRLDPQGRFAAETTKLVEKLKEGIAKSPKKD